MDHASVYREPSLVELISAADEDAIEFEPERLNLRSQTVEL